MTLEQQEFMHKAGELIAISGRVHKLLEVSRGFTAADSEREEYLAVCGAESQSWSMPSKGITEAQFFANPTDAIIKGYMICRDCFPWQNVHDS